MFATLLCLVFVRIFVFQCVCVYVCAREEEGCFQNVFSVVKSWFQCACVCVMVWERGVFMNAFQCLSRQIFDVSVCQHIFSSVSYMCV